MAERTRKYRVIRAVLWAGNRVLRWLQLHGLGPKPFVLLETTGRRSGLTRRTPVADGLVDGTFWLIAVHGPQADWFRNIEQNPRVRVLIRRTLARRDGHHPARRRHRRAVEDAPAPVGRRARPGDRDDAGHGAHRLRRRVMRVEPLRPSLAGSCARRRVRSTTPRQRGTRDPCTPRSTTRTTPILGRHLVGPAVELRSLSSRTASFGAIRPNIPT